MYFPLLHTVTCRRTHTHTHTAHCCCLRACRCCTWQRRQTPLPPPPHLAGTADDRMAINTLSLSLSLSLSLFLSHTHANKHECTWQHTHPHSHSLTRSHWSEDNCGTSHPHCQNTDNRQTDRQWGSKFDRRSHHTNKSLTEVCSFPLEKKRVVSFIFPWPQSHTQTKLIM